MARTRGPTWRYPDRTRCIGCRSYFGFVVLDGLYCSARCARVPEISADPSDWPREHFSIIGGVRRAKRNWETVDRAEAAARRNGKQAYRCGYCLGQHIGSPDPAKVYPTDRIESR